MLLKLLQLGRVKGEEGAGVIKERAHTAAGAPSRHELVEGLLKDKVTWLSLPQTSKLVSPILNGVCVCVRACVKRGEGGIINHLLHM